MIVISRQTMQAMAGLALFFLPIPNSISSPICVQRMSDGGEKELDTLLNVCHFQGKTLLVQTKPAFSPSMSPQAATLIGADRMGPAVIGRTLGELRRSLGSHDSLQPKQKLMVDIEAIPLLRDGDIQLYILFPAGTTITDQSVIRSLLTKNPHFKTKEGVGPGTKLVEAEAIYGQPTLSYNTSNESREYVSFTRQPSPQIRFGVKRLGPEMAGAYATPRQEYNQTQRYHPSASIGFVQVTVPAR